MPFRNKFNHLKYIIVNKEAFINSHQKVRVE